MTYTDFESILVPKDDGKQNLNESYTNKYKKHLACSYKLVSIGNKFSKLFTSYLGKDTVCSFISSMIKESKYCSDVMKKDFKKELVMSKEDNEDFENSSKCWICDNVKVRDHTHITGKYRGSVYRYCTVNAKK